MSRRLPSLNALRAFEAAARHLSFSRAADELCVTQGAVSRQIKLLEQYLGVPLFNRVTRRVELTDYGRDYLPVARDAFDRIEQASLRLMDRRSARALTVSVLPTLGMSWLTPRLAHFTARHPDIDVRMTTSIKPVNFEREEIDIAIRVGSLPDDRRSPGDPRIDLQMVEDWDQVKADLLMPDVLVAVCSPAFRAALDVELTPADLLTQPLLHTTTRPHAWPDWFDRAGVPHDDLGGGATFGHFFMTLQAALEGRGMALIPQVLGEAELARGTLVTPVEMAIHSAGDYYILSREHQWDAYNVRQFREWLLSEAIRIPPQALRAQPAVS